MFGRGDARQPCRVLSGLERALAALVIAEQRKRREEHGESQKQLFDPRIVWLEPQPEMQTEATVNPDDHHEDRLQRAGEGRVDPELQQLLRVSLLEPKLAERHARAGQMIGEEERNPKAKHELGRFEPGPAETASRIERPEAEAHVGEEREIEDRRAGRRLPDRLLNEKAAFQRFGRDVAERMIGEMQRHIGEENEAGREPDLAKAGHGGA